MFLVIFIDPVKGPDDVQNFLWYAVMYHTLLCTYIRDRLSWIG